MNAKEQLLDCPNLFAKIKPNRDGGIAGDSPSGGKRAVAS